MIDDAYAVAYADIDWHELSTPASTTHDDIYWSRGQGLAEKEQVFVTSGYLRERWQEMGHAHFTVAEIGFGFGLNFLLTAAAWQSTRTAGAILNYVAFEKAPVSPADLSRLFATLLTGKNAALAQLADRLVSQYPTPASSGWHTLWVSTDICLILVIGDATRETGQLVGSVDAWFLDGFSPAKNPDAWQASLIHNMATHSAPGATVTSYSVAGQIRRDLASAGFQVTKQPGFGRKAEMLFARWPGNWRAAPLEPRRIAIIGAGLAGLHCARALRRRGFTVTIFEASEAALSGASGVPHLAVYPQLSVQAELGSLFSMAAFQYAVRESGATTIGRCQLADTAAARQRLQQIGSVLPDTFATYLNRAQMHEVLGQDTGHDGLHFAGGAFVSPAEFFHADLPQVTTGRMVTDLSAGHLVLAGGTRAEFETIVIATGAAPMPATDALGLRPVRGQAIVGDLGYAPPRAMIAGPLSVIPHRQSVLVGATYADGDSIEPRPEDTTELLTRLARLMDTSHFQPAAAYVGTRCTTRDRKPVSGPLPNWTALTDHCRAESSRQPFSAYEEGLYVFTGFGSHGATNAPLAAEDLARQISGEVACMGARWRARFNTARFALRDAGRKRELTNHLNEK